ncbi:MAG: hypothetical protein MI724_05440 [Spirochaetales bacterium]|nr:hypothetical protein [Spirochaetales bacterium]
MKKIMLTLLLMNAAVIAFAGGQGEDQASSDAPAPDAMARPTQYVIESPSDVQAAVGADGAWIIIFQDDVAVDSRVVVSGEVSRDGEPRRKFALYTQDADRNVTARYTLTVPELVVQHVNVRIQSGTVAGDVYVESEGFHLRDATIDGNVYFATQDLLDGFVMDETSMVTGEVAVASM